MNEYAQSIHHLPKSESSMFYNAFWNFEIVCTSTVQHLLYFPYAPHLVIFSLSSLFLLSVAFFCLVFNSSLFLELHSWKSVPSKFHYQWAKGLFPVFTEPTMWEQLIVLQEDFPRSSLLGIWVSNRVFPLQETREATEKPTSVTQNAETAIIWGAVPRTPLCSSDVNVQCYILIAILIGY